MTGQAYYSALEKRKETKRNVSYFCKLGCGFNKN